MVVKVPTVKSVTKMAQKSLINGCIGGVAVGIGTNVLGPILGPILGGILAGAALNDEIIAKNAVMDAVAIMFIGGGGW